MKVDNHIYPFISNELICVLYVYTTSFLIDNMINQTKHISVLPLINKSIKLTKSLTKYLILVLCVYFPFLNSFSQNQEVDLHSCTNGKFTQFFYPSGNISSQGCLNNGKAEGEWVSFFEDGNIKSKGNYNLNKLNGLWVFYHSNTQIEKEIVYKNDQKNGIEKTYSEDGILIIKTTWVLNIKEGEEERYFDSGELQHVTFYSEGLKEGKCLQYAKDGRLIAFKTYKKGVVFSTDRFNRFNKYNQKTGIWKEFFDNLLINEEGPWVDGKKHGIFRTYDKRGDLKNLERFEFGVLVVDEEILDPTEVIRLYHPNGQCSTETVYKNGIKHGVHREYDSNGQIISGGVFNNGLLIENGITNHGGKKQGVWTLYYKNGEVKAVGEYQDGLRVGEWVFYYETGEIEQKGFYKKGEYDGLWKWTFKNKDIKRIEKYINGVEHGEFVEYDSLKNVLLKGVYNNGLREGGWVYHVNDHKEEGEYLSGQKNSVWTHTFSDGTIIFKGEYSYNEPVGVHKVWSSTGILLSTGRYKNGLKHGKWQHFNENGEIDRFYKYKNGVLIKVDGRKVQESEQS